MSYGLQKWLRNYYNGVTAYENVLYGPDTYRVSRGASIQGHNVGSNGSSRSIWAYAMTNGDTQILHLWDCVPAPTQQWKHLPDGQFQNVQTGKCLAVREDSSENGTVLHIWDCHPGQTEKWSFGH